MDNFSLSQTSNNFIEFESEDLNIISSTSISVTSPLMIISPPKFVQKKLTQPKFSAGPVKLAAKLIDALVTTICCAETISFLKATSGTLQDVLNDVVVELPLA
ncbi:hypothetical protein RCL1_002966 [Eukaryota sp. TZLM3-RCL]